MINDIKCFQLSQNELFHGDPTAKLTFLSKNASHHNQNYHSFAIQAPLECRQPWTSETDLPSAASQGSSPTSDTVSAHYDAGARQQCPAQPGLLRCFYHTWLPALYTHTNSVCHRKCEKSWARAVWILASSGPPGDLRRSVSASPLCK